MDTTAPSLSQVTAVASSTNDTTPNYTFSSNEAGTISYGGSCTSSNSSALASNNTITFNTLSDGSYSNCTVTVTDNVGNQSSELTINTFIIDTVPPNLTSVSPTDNQTLVLAGVNISVTFSEAMNNTTITTNTINTSCNGNIQISSDNFTSCVQMSSSPSSSNYNRTFTLDPLGDLAFLSTYKILVTTGVKDVAGNSIGNDNETPIGFTVKKPWTQQIGGDLHTQNVGLALTTDSSGNIYGTGYTESNLSTFLYNNNVGANDIFLFKYNSAGTKQWVSLIGTSNSDKGNGIGIDPSGYIIVTGYTGGNLGGQTMRGCVDIIKRLQFQLSGDPGTIQTQLIGGLGCDYAEDMFIDSSGNIYITGYTTRGFSGNNNNHTGDSWPDMFLITPEFSTILGTPSSEGLNKRDKGRGVTADSSGNVYVVGTTEGNFNGVTSNGFKDIFIVKYNSSGIIQWTKLLGSSINEGNNTDVTMDSSGNVYIMGSTYSALSGHSSSGGLDIILAKYNSSGSLQWTKQYGTSDEDSPVDMQIDTNGNNYIVGQTTGDFENYTNNGSYDIFISKFNSSGNLNWTKQYGTSERENVHSLAIDLNENIYITGSTEGSMDGNVKSEAYTDIFLMKLNSSGEKY